MSKDFLQEIMSGTVVGTSGATAVAAMPWNNHPKFTGVTLKHLLTGADTDGKFSNHLVWVQAGCVIGEHIHPGQWELHEVLHGQGACLIDGKEVAYAPGISAAIPADQSHSVHARNEDLYLFATFIPALL